MSNIQVTFTVEILVNLLLIDSNTKSTAGLNFERNYFISGMIFHLAINKFV